MCVQVSKKEQFDSNIKLNVPLIRQLRANKGIIVPSMNSAAMNQHAALKRSYKYYYKISKLLSKIENPTHKSAPNQLLQNCENQISVISKYLRNTTLSPC